MSYQLNFFKGKYQKLTLVLALLLVLVYLFRDILWNELWVWSVILLVMMALAFIITIVTGLIRKEKGMIPILILVLISVAIDEAINTEVFKSVKVLEAVLDDDRSAIQLVLRADNTFEININTLFSNDEFKGRYKLLGEQIIFLDKPCDSGFVPDTVSIIRDKIILHFDNSGEPIVDFATYFDIKLNHFKGRR